MYKFISYADYTTDYSTSHPNARVNLEQTEVVLSCNRHASPCACLSHTEALAYIEANWAEVSEGTAKSNT